MDTMPIAEADARPPVRTSSQVVGLNLAVVFGYFVVFSLFWRDSLGLTALVMVPHALVCLVTQVVLAIVAKRDPSPGWLYSALILFVLGVIGFLVALSRSLSGG